MGILDLRPTPSVKAFAPGQTLNTSRVERWIERFVYMTQGLALAAAAVVIISMIVTCVLVLWVALGSTLKDFFIALALVVIIIVLVLHTLLLAFVNKLDH
jgi:Flp pilus assembly protein TadB